MHGRDKNGAIASLSYVAKLRYRDSQDGIRNTFSIVPNSLGATEELSLIHIYYIEKVQDWADDRLRRMCGRITPPSKGVESTSLELVTVNCSGS